MANLLLMRGYPWTVFTSTTGVNGAVSDNLALQQSVVPMQVSYSVVTGGTVTALQLDVYACNGDPTVANNWTVIDSYTTAGNGFQVINNFVAQMIRFNVTSLTGGGNVTVVVTRS